MALRQSTKSILIIKEAVFNKLIKSPSGDM